MRDGGCRRCRGHIDGGDVVRDKKRYDDQRARIGEAAAAIARARRNDAQDFARTGLEHGAAAEAFFDVNVFEFQVDPVVGPRSDRARKEHARFLADHADEFVVLHVARYRNEIALDHRMRARSEMRRVQSAAVDREQREIPRPRPVDVRGEIVEIAADVDANARRARDNVRCREHDRVPVVRIDHDARAALHRTSGPVERPHLH